jgi:hypothetical protein
VLPFMVMWSFWFLLRWLGVRWAIVIERDGKKVGQELVRGWGKSGQRIDEFARAAEAGALEQRIPRRRRSEWACRCALMSGQTLRFCRTIVRR